MLERHWKYSRYESGYRKALHPAGRYKRLSRFLCTLTWWHPVWYGALADIPCLCGAGGRLHRSSEVVSAG